MSSENYDMELFQTKLNSSENKVAGFGVDLTENGFILSIIFVKNDEDGFLREARASFSFGSDVKLENILDNLVGKIKMQKL